MIFKIQLNIAIHCLKFKPQKCIKTNIYRMVMKITFLFILCLAGLFPALTTNQDHDNTAKKEQS